MGRRPLADRLEDIHAAAADVIAFMAGMDEDAFITLPSTDRRTWRALKNALSEIGEAVKDLPPEATARHSGVDWRGFAGLRDIVAHAYFGLDLPRLRPTVTEEIPALLVAVEAELARLREGGR